MKRAYLRLKIARFKSSAKQRCWYLYLWHGANNCSMVRTVRNETVTFNCKVCSRPVWLSRFGGSSSRFFPLLIFDDDLASFLYRPYTKNYWYVNSSPPSFLFPTLGATRHSGKARILINIVYTGPFFPQIFPSKHFELDHYRKYFIQIKVRRKTTFFLGL